MLLYRYYQKNNNSKGTYFLAGSPVDTNRKGAGEMRLTQLHYFIKVVDCGGVNAAARELLVSQPTVSTAIRELEAELEVPLFRRIIPFSLLQILSSLPPEKLHEKSHLLIEMAM